MYTDIVYINHVFQITMSEKEMFQREIKRSGYLRGTRMKVVRTKIVFAILAVTVASYAIPA